ncbi:hypothetical protein AAHB65_01960 [Bacillus toyonensis]
MRRDGDELDERGYPQDAYTKVDNFIVKFKEDPDDFPEFRDRIYYTEEIKNHQENFIKQMKKHLDVRLKSIFMKIWKLN